MTKLKTGGKSEASRRFTPLPSSSALSNQPPKKKHEATTAKQPPAGLPPAGRASDPGVIFIRVIRTGGPLDVIKRIRAGFPADSLRSISLELGIPRLQLYDAVGIPRSTAESRIRDKKNLTAAESDRVVRVLKALDRATEVLEGDDSAKRWLQQPVRSLGGASPLSLLDTEAGYELVLDTLGRIEQGIVA